MCTINIDYIPLNDQYSKEHRETLKKLSSIDEIINTQHLIKLQSF